MTPAYLARMRWHCRRGMLELDVILEKFFDQQFMQLSAAEQQQFERLLSCEDQYLFRWLMGAEQPNDDELKAIVTKIRQHL